VLDIGPLHNSRLFFTQNFDYVSSTCVGHTQWFVECATHFRMHRSTFGSVHLMLDLLEDNEKAMDVEREFDIETRFRVEVHPRNFLICKKPSCA